MTVACIDADAPAIEIDLSDITVTTTKDSGPGGQHRNKTESAVIIKDNRTGITAKSAKKSQHHNRKVARQTLIERITELETAKQKSEQDILRSLQVGSGMRGDKVRTYNAKDDRVKSNITGKQSTLRKIVEGNLTLVWS